MTELQERFVDEYCLDCNGAAAARRAGYSPDTARQKAYELLHDEEIAAAIKTKLDDLSMTVEVAVKHLSDVANTRLNEFMVIRQVQGREQSEQYVTVLLAQAKAEIERIRQFLKDEDLEKKGGLAFKKKIRQLQLKALEYEADIEHYGNDVTRLAPGKPCLMEVAELDLVALARAKDIGRIKNYTVTKDGVKVEMYAADAAAKSILEFHGKIVQKHEHTFTDLDKLSPDELETLQRLQQTVQGQ